SGIAASTTKPLCRSIALMRCSCMSGPACDRAGSIQTLRVRESSNMAATRSLAGRLLRMPRSTSRSVKTYPDHRGQYEPAGDEASGGAVDEFVMGARQSRAGHARDIYRDHRADGEQAIAKGETGAILRLGDDDPAQEGERDIGDGGTF